MQVLLTTELQTLRSQPCFERQRQLAINVLVIYRTTYLARSCLGILRGKALKNKKI